MVNNLPSSFKQEWERIFMEVNKKDLLVQIYLTPHIISL